MRWPIRILHPDGFHGQAAMRPTGGVHGWTALWPPSGRPGGRPRRRAFFEGWYVKMVSADRATRLALIPGMFISQDRSVVEAFIQVLNGADGQTAYHRFDLAQFRAAAGPFHVRLDGNSFDGGGVAIDVPGVRADVRFGQLAPWPVTVREPGAMGWYAWVPTMECYHGVVSMDHSLRGWVDLGSGPVDMSGGRGYLEKDWGTAFPQGYVWIQCNHFQTTGVSLMASTALIPWRRSAFRGDLVGLRVPDGPARGLHRFTSYTGARTERLEVDDEAVRWRVASPAGVRLEIEAHIGGRTTGLLHAPVRTQMHQRVAETLDGHVEVRLSGGSGRTIFHEEGQVAGIEVHGDIHRLLATPGRQRRSRARPLSGHGPRQRAD